MRNPYFAWVARLLTLWPSMPVIPKRTPIDVAWMGFGNVAETPPMWAQFSGFSAPRWTSLECSANRMHSECFSRTYVSGKSAPRIALLLTGIRHSLQWSWPRIPEHALLSTAIRITHRALMKTLARLTFRSMDGCTLRLATPHTPWKWCTVSGNTTKGLDNAL